MLTKIHETLWIDISDIYLVDYDENSKEMMVYIKTHPKIPIILDRQEDIEELINILERENERKDANAERQDKDEQTSSESILGCINTRAES